MKKTRKKKVWRAVILIAAGDFRLHCKLQKWCLKCSEHDLNTNSTRFTTTYSISLHEFLMCPLLWFFSRSYIISSFDCENFQWILIIVSGKNKINEFPWQLHSIIECKHTNFIINSIFINFFLSCRIHFSLSRR